MSQQLLVENYNIYVKLVLHVQQAILLMLFKDFVEFAHQIVVLVQKDF